MEKKHYSEIDGAKLILILGVIGIHSSLLTLLPEGNDLVVARYTMDFVSAKLNMVCVPIFFILSGFLMFHGVDRLSLPLYRRKLRSRVRTLLIPYLLWNVIAAAIFLLKSKFLGFPDFGVFENGRFHFLTFLKGFWVLHETYPFDFPLWFLRNLIVFCVLSPVAFIVGRYSLITLIPLTITIFTGDNLYGATYFILGVWLAQHNAVYRAVNTKSYAAVGTIIFLACSCVLTFTDYELPPLFFLSVAGALGCFLEIGKILSQHQTRFSRLLTKATFFLYASHGLYVTVAKKLWIHLIGMESNTEVIIEYLLSFLTLTSISLAFYLLLNRFSPSVTALLCGGRNQKHTQSLLDTTTR